MSSSDPIQLPPDLQARLDAAGVHDHTSLMAALEADPALRADFQAVVGAHQQERFQALWREFVSVVTPDELRELAERAPFVLEDGFLATVEREIQHAEQAGHPLVADGLRQRLGGLHELRSGVTSELPAVAQAVMDFIQAESVAGARQVFAGRQDLLDTDTAQTWLDEQFTSQDPEVQQVLEARRALLRTLRHADNTPEDAPTGPDQMFNRYVALRNNAAGQQDIAAWQQAVDAGESLLALPLDTTAGLDQDFIRCDVARAYNELGHLLDAAEQLPAALAAYERAVALQPDFAMWHRNHAGVLIALGRLDEAEKTVARARELEPTAVRLAELVAELDQAREQRA